MTLIPDLQRDLVDAAARLKRRRQRYRLWLRLTPAVVVAAVLIGAAVVLFGGGGSDLAPSSRESGGSPQNSPRSTPPERSSEPRPRRGSHPTGERQRSRPAIDPASVTVAVLNGTTVPGLASRVSDEVRSAGFEVGTVANSPDQERAESVVLFSPGHEREAAAVSRTLDIPQREPIDAATQGLAGDATVVVVTGAPRPPPRRGPTPMPGSLSQAVRFEFAGVGYSIVGLRARSASRDGLICTRLVERGGGRSRRLVGATCAGERLLHRELDDRPARTVGGGGQPIQISGFARADVAGIAVVDSQYPSRVVLSEPWSPEPWQGEPIRFFLVLIDAPQDRAPAFPRQDRPRLEARLTSGELVDVVP